MRCPHCLSTATTERSDRTELGYRRFRCRNCGRVFNERTGTPFNRLQYPTDVVSLVIFWRFRYKLSLRDLAEMFLQRGILFTHEAVREWESKLAPLLSETLRKQRHVPAGTPEYRVIRPYPPVPVTPANAARVLEESDRALQACPEASIAASYAHMLKVRALLALGRVPEAEAAEAAIPPELIEVVEPARE